jgi:hypothetical protein
MLFGVELKPSGEKLQFIAFSFDGSADRKSELFDLYHPHRFLNRDYFMFDCGRMAQHEDVSVRQLAG